MSEQRTVEFILKSLLSGGKEFEILIVPFSGFLVMTL
jgi:hypothetical protein